LAFESKLSASTLAPPAPAFTADLHAEGDPRPASFTADNEPDGEKGSYTEIPRLDRFRFHSAILPNPDDRPLLVYLPVEYYENPTRRFPVFYLHDGQNLFDDATAYIPGHPWNCHLAADRMTASGLIEPVILVGIANTGLRRMAEYTPTRDPKLGGGEGRIYGRVLLEEIKPFLDETYRTRPTSADTALGGSSLGGLISLFLGFEHPNTFGKIAALSPSLWWDHRAILPILESHHRQNLRIWLDMGLEEGARHVRDTDLLVRQLERRGWHLHHDLEYRRVPGATHSEDAWAARFDQVLQFLFPAT
jgi:predicted alpha/beta superfamily hydrolase